jgi:hypothetical protein
MYIYAARLFPRSTFDGTLTLGYSFKVKTYSMAAEVRHLTFDKPADTYHLRAGLYRLQNHWATLVESCNIILY